MKKLLALVFVCCLFLVGCDSNNASKAQMLATGSIEHDLKGNITDEYLSYYGNDKVLAYKSHENLIFDMAQTVQYLYCYYEETDSNYTKQIEPHFKQLLESFEYTVSDVYEDEEGNFCGTITYSPYAIGDVLDPIAYDFYENAPEQGTFSDTSYAKLRDGELNPLLVEGVAKFAQNPTYKPQTTASFVVSFGDTHWAISGGYNTFLNSVFDYNLE